jgi:hypothetical protein
MMAIFEPLSPGWWRISPSPLLLIPILIGCRHGLNAGLGSGAWCSFCCAVSEAWPVLIDIPQCWYQSPYFYMSFPAAGILCGEVYRHFATTLGRQRIEVEHMRNRLRGLDSEVHLLRGSRDELERLLAARDVELTTLDYEVRRLTQSRPEDIYNNLLRLLGRQARVADGAVYRVEGTALTRIALLGSPVYLPESLDGKTTPVVKECLEAQDVALLPELLAREAKTAIRPAANILFTIPFLDARGRVFALLAVAGLPFIAMHRRTVQLAKLICQWTAQVIEVHADTDGRFRRPGVRGAQRITTPSHIKTMLELCFRIQKTFGLPTSVVILRMEKGTQVQIEDALLGAVRSGDTAAQLEDPRPHLIVLLPITGRNGAEIFLKRTLAAGELSLVGSELGGRVVSVEEHSNFESLWQDVTKL